MKNDHDGQKDRDTGKVIQLDPMFSAGSFYDVIHADNSLLVAEGPSNRAPIVAFYGLKGGAGRTTALAHTAALLAAGGAKIVVVDLDLEAPGLDVMCNVSVDREVKGTAAILRRAMLSPPGEGLDVRSSLLPVPLDSAVGGVWLLPAGRLDDSYLATIEELNLNVWASLEPPQPLQRVLSEIMGSDIRPDAIFLDCRTGFHPLSAVALFHVADTIALFLPVSPQVWDGLTVVVSALTKAREMRHGRPDIIVLPTLVPPEPAGGPLIRRFKDDLDQRFGSSLVSEVDNEAVEDPDDEASWLGEAIPYDISLASSGRLDNNLRKTSWNSFRSLAEYLGSSFSTVGDSTPTAPLNFAKVLDELKIDSGVAFGEEVDIETLVDTFVAPGDLARILDRSSSLVVGAKGAGKTWLFRYLVGHTNKPRPHVPTDMAYLVGHAPASVVEKGDLHLSKEALKELEKACKMTREGTHIAFWRLYACASIGNSLPAILKAASGKIPKIARRLLEVNSSAELQAELERLLSLPDAGTLSSSVIKAVDDILFEQRTNVTLVYDGLDTGFDVGSDADARQDRFIKALLQLILERREFRRIQLKVFLREDLSLRIEMQNRSHLEATTVEIRWRAVDLWRMALVRARESAEYRRVIAALPGGVDEPTTVADEAVLRRLLDPLWGATVQGGRKARTAFYIQKRTSDAAGRLFPRTLMQLLSAAVKYEKNADGASRDRVLRFASIREGVEKASAQRVDDLVAEYAELGPYLLALKGRNPTGTEQELINHLKQNIERGPRRNRRGVAAGSLHAGAGGWRKVVDALRQVGVLGEYKRAKGRGRKETLAVALLYRPGLDIRAAT